MKKYILITAIVLMGALTACSSDDNKDTIDDTTFFYEGTWIADDLSYKIGDREFNHKFIEMPGTSQGQLAIYDNDKLILTKDTAILYEYKNSIGEETQVKGSIKNNLITFENPDYSIREIIGVKDNRLTIIYDISMRGATLPVTVTYKIDNNTSIPNPYEGTWIADDLSYKYGDREFNHKFIEMPGEYAVNANDKLVLTKDTAVLYENKKSVGEETQVKGSIANNIITFEDTDYSTREIVGVKEDRLTIIYDITMRGATLPVTIIYNKQ